MIANTAHHACPSAGLTNLEIAGIAVLGLWFVMTVLCAAVLTVQWRRALKARRDAEAVPGGWVPSHVCVPREGLMQ